MNGDGHSPAPDPGYGSTEFDGAGSTLAAAGAGAFELDGTGELTAVSGTAIEPAGTADDGTPVGDLETLFDEAGARRVRSAVERIREDGSRSRGVTVTVDAPGRTDTMSVTLGARDAGGVAGVVTPVATSGVEGETERRLSDVLSSIEGVSTVASVLEVVLEGVYGEMGWTRASAWVPGEDGGPDRVSSMNCDPDGDETGEDGVRGLVREAFSTGEPIWVHDAATPDDAAVSRFRHETREDVGTALAVPVTRGDRVEAAMVFEAPETWTPSDVEVDVLASLADRLGEPIARRRAETDLTGRLLSAAPVSIAVVGPDGEFRWANRRARDRLGTETDGRYEVGERDVYDEDGDFVPRGERPYLEVFETGDPLRNWTCQIDLPDHGRRWLSIDAVPLGDGDEVEEVVISGDDVTRRKARAEWIERQRDELEGELESVFERIRDGFFAVDGDWEFTYVNEHACELIDCDRSDVIGRTLWETAPEPLGTEIRDEYERAMDAQEPITFEAYYERRDRWVEVNAYPSDSGMSAYVRDVTERKRRERELERFETIVQTVNDGVYTVDEDGRFTMVNEKYRELTGYDESELVGESVENVVDDETVKRASNLEATMLDGESESPVVQADVQTKGGDSIPTEATFAMLSVGEDSFERVGVVRDVTERKRYQETLERLYDSATELLAAETKTEVSSVVVAAAANVLEIPGVGIYRYDGDEDVLSPGELSLEGEFMDGKLPSITPDDGTITGHAFSAGETRHYEDVRDSEYHGDDGPDRDLRAGMFAPMGDHGVLIAGSDEVGSFDEETRHLFELLAANAEESYDRVEREVKLQERERTLERYRRIVETIDDGVYVLDEDLNFEMVNESLVEMTGRTRDELLGAYGSVVFGDDFEEIADETSRELHDGDLEVARLEEEVHTADDETLVVESSFSLFPLDDRDGVGRVGVIRDVTERKERERELERYQTIVESVWDGVYALDPDGNFVMANEEYLSMVGYSEEELLDKSGAVVHGESIAEDVKEMTSEIVFGDRETASVEFELETVDGGTVPVETRFGPYPYGEGTFGRTGVVRDISDRLERERNLNRRLARQRVVANLGRTAMETDDLGALFDEAAERVAETLDAEFSKVVTLDEDHEELTVRAGVGWTDGVVGSTTIPADDSQTGYTFANDDPTYSPDLDEESRFQPSDLLVDHDVASGVSATIGSIDEPYGAIGVHSRERDHFSEESVTFLRSVATTLGSAIDRIRYQDELENRREELATLNRLNELAQEITHAAVESSNRDELEEVVCSNLADSNHYQFAWIGEYDRTDEEVRLRHEGGFEGYLEDATITLDGDHGDGPTGRAIRTQEVQVCDDVLDAPEFEPWREEAMEYGFRSTAAVPIVFEGTLYGVLNLYTGRIGAFGGYERTVVGRLGEVLGHAINAIERKRALIADEVVEIDFLITDLFDALDIDESIDGAITFERSLSVDDETYVTYGRVSESAEETLRTVVDELDHFESVEVLGEGPGDSRFKVTLVDPPVISLAAALGGRVTGARIEGGDYRMTAQIPQSADVGKFAESVTAEYPAATVVAQRQTKPSEGPQAREVLTEELTERQRTTLEASYFAGFFDWPRESTGEEVAETLDISAPTFHQHCRIGQQKIMRAIFHDR